MISAFVFATWIVKFLYFLIPKFPASSYPLCLYSSVYGGPGRKPRRLVFSCRGLQYTLLFLLQFIFLDFFVLVNILMTIFHKHQKAPKHFINVILILALKLRYGKTKSRKAKIVFELRINIPVNYLLGTEPPLPGH